MTVHSMIYHTPRYKHRQYSAYFLGEKCLSTKFVLFFPVLVKRKLASQMKCVCVCVWPENGAGNACLAGGWAPWGEKILKNFHWYWKKKVESRVHFQTVRGRTDGVEAVGNRKGERPVRLFRGQRRSPLIPIGLISIPG